eukprot:CAMPEP_0113548008 /NCGR_PEP_ID=MMETSP0015_2-20120614/12663_1 /TAXON_ID=2838 /ORGANISM="Odontella" /LENGTH=275 /DNA_ID=CAMNT_0000448607 /DNA_START=129 /DNA_END=959 /DNA_ORIENTATION=+ /assembly_acc=CAM_ASM_000160
MTQFSSSLLGPARIPVVKARWIQSLKAPSNNITRFFSSKIGSDNKESLKESPNIPYEIGYHKSDGRFVNGKPSLEYVKAMPSSFSSMRHEQILQLSAEGIPEACKEALIRNIMGVESIDYERAELELEKIAKSNRKNVFLHHIPHKVGLFGAISAGVVSFPLVFHLGTVQAFNEMFVTADVPEAKDIETWLEVGSWSWAWMEPLIGQASFFLLTMQFARAQIQNIGVMPYSDYIRDMRARRLVKLYPNYNPAFVTAFSMSDRHVYKSHKNALWAD